MRIKDLKNSCNGRGCKINHALPRDCEFVVIRSKMYGSRNDIPKVLPIINVLMDKVA